ncbi:hypothetical protein [Taibaiella soli]|uniref:Uncharacterized protein n=1 Tax=Taibaiella soli TaxID=1649169 RepID=A0A2W2AFV5_9BACT|nr:hypothetical protein [Taibaiella soli]PZF71110.1 hypothetical protein DN068_20655 [Taibaiella soli]
MKKLLVLPLALVLSTTFGQTKNEQSNKPTANKEAKPFVKHAAASAYRDGGLYIFTDCKPQVSYTVMGSINGDPSTNYETTKKNFVTQAKQKYYKADGLILFFSNDGSSRADVIKFK